MHIFVYQNLNSLMATLRQFSLFDMLQYNNINLDILT
jgi:hypothetical protein